MQFSKYKHGGDEEDRTPDPLRARQVLSQLSYTPIFFRKNEDAPFLRIFSKTLKIKQRLKAYPVI